MKKQEDRDRGWFADLFSGLFDGIDAIEGLFWVVRIVGHGLFIAGRVVFHLLTCHF